MDEDEQAIAQFVADQTGLEMERAARIVNIGEPWPIVTALDKLFRGLSSDAKAAGVSWEMALDARSSLVQMDLEATGPGGIEAHLKRTAILTGESAETVEAVQAALHAYLQSQFVELKQGIRRTTDRSKDEAS